MLIRDRDRFVLAMARCARCCGGLSASTRVRDRTRAWQETRNTIACEPRRLIITSGSRIEIEIEIGCAQRQYCIQSNATRAED
jgi:hypothetical protein